MYKKASAITVNFVQRHRITSYFEIGSHQVSQAGLEPQSVVLAALELVTILTQPSMLALQRYDATPGCRTCIFNRISKEFICAFKFERHSL